jgi:gliding motility-associated-like protein
MFVNSINLTAPISTSYQWIGPNGFSSNLPNPTILNATVINNGVYSCPITGINGCDYTINVIVTVGDNVKPVPNTTTLSDITGDCNTIITTIPTALDNCAGTITATTVDPLSYSTSGLYIIHWSYNDGNGNTSTQNQNVIISETALPTIVTSPQNFCIQQNATLSLINITGQNIQYYDALTNGNLLPNTTTLVNGITYYASQTINNCESKRVPVTINIQNTSAPTGTNQSFCTSQNATLHDVVATGTAINWYATNTSTAVLPVMTILGDAVTYYATQTVNNCESVTRLPITVTLINTLNANNFAIEFCDDLNDGAEIVNLTSYNTNLIFNTTNCTFAFYNSFIGATNQIISDAITNATHFQLGLGSKTIFVRITSSNGCHQIVELKVTLQPKPTLTIRDIEPICENSNVTIYGDLGYDDYTWSTGAKTTSITIANPGDYFLTVVKKYATIDCSTTKNFKVVASNVATISEIITSDWTTNDNSIVVLLTNNSLGNYEYSLDGINYQDTNSFSGLNSGEYTVYIRDKNGCGITFDNAYLLMYPKFFTPNGDGFNDTWKIKFSANESNLKIKIFDRFGKLLKDLDNNSEGWNGLFNGQELPSTDYWFTVIRANGKEYKGRFAMKR